MILWTALSILKYISLNIWSRLELYSVVNSCWKFDKCLYFHLHFSICKTLCKYLLYLYVYWYAVFVQMLTWNKLVSGLTNDALQYWSKLHEKTYLMKQSTIFAPLKVTQVKLPGTSLNKRPFKIWILWMQHNPTRYFPNRLYLSLSLSCLEVRNYLNHN